MIYFVGRKAMAINMAIYDTVRNSITVAVDTVSCVTQTIIEKNRTKAKMNRLRTVMKNEAEMINRAYITLGKKYYENKINNRSDSCKDEEELFKIIENSKEQIRRARERYRRLIESQTVEVIRKYDAGDLEDITVACSNEDEYDESPFVAEESAEQESAEVEENIDITPKDTFDEEVADGDAF